MFKGLKIFALDMVKVVADKIYDTAYTNKKLPHWTSLWEQHYDERRWQPIPLLSDQAINTLHAQQYRHRTAALNPPNQPNQIPNDPQLIQRIENDISLFLPPEENPLSKRTLEKTIKKTLNNLNLSSDCYLDSRFDFYIKQDHLNYQVLITAPIRYSVKPHRFYLYFPIYTHQPFNPSDLNPELSFFGLQNE